MARKFQKFITIILSAILLHVFAGVSAEIKITSDQFIVNETSSSATFTGNVIIKQPDLIVYANKVVVHYGAGGPSDLKDFEAIGGVKIVQPEQTAKADRGVYNPKSKILTLYDNVAVTNESGTIMGSELIIDTISGISKFPSQSDGGRVTAVFSQ